jgi:hypothetical protein
MIHNYVIQLKIIIKMLNETNTLKYLGLIVHTLLEIKVDAQLQNTIQNIFEEDDEYHFFYTLYEIVVVI